MMPLTCVNRSVAAVIVFILTFTVPESAVAGVPAGVVRVVAGAVRAVSRFFFGPKPAEIEMTQAMGKKIDYRIMGDISSETIPSIGNPPSLPRRRSSDEIMAPKTFEPPVSGGSIYMASKKQRQSINVAAGGLAAETGAVASLESPPAHKTPSDEVIAPNETAPSYGASEPYSYFHATSIDRFYADSWINEWNISGAVPQIQDRQKMQDVLIGLMKADRAISFKKAVEAIEANVAPVEPTAMTLLGLCEKNKKSPVILNKFLVRQSYRYTPKMVEREDLIQETLMKIIENCNQIIAGHVKNAAGYAVTIMKNIWNDQFRHEKYIARFEANDLNVDDFAHKLVDNTYFGSDPSKIIELRQFFNVALYGSGLTSRQRQALLLSQEFSIEKTAKIMNISQYRVKLLLAGAKENIKPLVALKDQ